MSALPLSVPIRTAACAATATFACSPVVRRYLIHREWMDQPNHRSSHSVPVPRGGGIACFVGYVSGWVASAGRLNGQYLLPVTVLAATGLVDDRTGGLSSRLRLAIQTGAGALSLPNLPVAGRVLALAAFPTIVNAVNFMDGINGISAGMAIVWGTQAVLVGRSSAQGDLALVGALVLGSAAGFLPHNAPMAHLFLGDVGSYGLGALIATGVTLAARRPSLLIPAAAPLALYTADTATTLVRRHRRGEKLTEAHREHVYQQLVHQESWSHSAVATFHAGLATLVATGARTSSPWGRAAALVGGVGAYLAAPLLSRRFYRG